MTRHTCPGCEILVIQLGETPALACDLCGMCDMCALMGVDASRAYAARWGRTMIATLAAAEVPA